MESENVSHMVTPFTRFEHAMVGFSYMVICMVGVVLNSLTALTLYKDTRLFTSSKPWLHISLALVNVGVVAPSAFPASSSFSGKWLYGSKLCQLYAFEGMFVGLLAIGLVMALCVERYVVGNKSNADESGWFYVGSILFTIFNALFWASMPLLGWSRYALDATGCSCSLDYGNPDDGFVSYLFCLEIFTCVLPLTVAVACLYNSNAAAPAVGTETSSASSSQTCQPQIVVTDQSYSGFSEGQLKTLCCIFLVLVFVGWGPFAVVCTLKSVTHGSSSDISMLANIIPPLACKITVWAYPTTYAIANPRFRKSFCSTFRRLGEQKQD